MITEKQTAKTLAGYSWDLIYYRIQKTHAERNNSGLFHDLLDPVNDFYAFMTGLMYSMDTHAYSMTAEQGFSWLYLASYQYHDTHEGTDKAYTDFLKMLVPDDYQPVPGDTARTRLYELFNSKVFVSPTHGAVLWNSFLQTGTEKRAKPNFHVYMVFPLLGRIMPPFYQKDTSHVDTFRREAIFMVLPVLLGKFAKPWQNREVTPLTDAK